MTDFPKPIDVLHSEGAREGAVLVYREKDLGDTGVASVMRAALDRVARDNNGLPTHAIQTTPFHGTEVVKYEIQGNVGITAAELDRAGLIDHIQALQISAKVNITPEGLSVTVPQSVLNFDSDVARNFRSTLDGIGEANQSFIKTAPLTGTVTFDLKGGRMEIANKLNEGGVIGPVRLDRIKEEIQNQALANAGITQQAGGRGQGA